MTPAYTDGAGAHEGERLGSSQAFFYGVSPLDPLVFFGVAALLSMVALVASVVPAIVAVKANPMDSLRYY